MAFLVHEADYRVIELITRTNYAHTQINGQRLYGPPNGYNGPKPPRGSELFCGRLPRDIFEDVLVPVFEQIAPLYQLRLMMDFSGTNRGFCFVSYWKPNDADRALVTLNHYEIVPGKRIGLYKSIDNCRLFFGNLPCDLTREQVIRDLNLHCAGVKDAVICQGRYESAAKSQAYAFVDFDDHRAAAMARKQFRPPPVRFWGQNIRVDWADPEPADPTFGNASSNLHIRCLPPYITERDILDLCAQLLTPEVQVKVKKIKNFAFIECPSADVSKTLKDRLEGYKIQDFTLHVTWSKPKGGSIRENKLKYYQGTLCTSFPFHMRRELEYYGTQISQLTSAKNAVIYI